MPAPERNPGQPTGETGHLERARRQRWSSTIFSPAISRRAHGLGSSTWSQRYEIGATPLREGLSRLISRGLIVGIGQRGFRVAEISREDLPTSPACARWSRSRRCGWPSPRATTPGRPGSSARCIRCAGISSAPATNSARAAEDFDRLHKGFHTALLAACGSRRLLAAHSDLYDQAYRYRRVMMRQFDSGKKFVAPTSCSPTACFRATFAGAQIDAGRASAFDAQLRLSPRQRKLTSWSSPRNARRRAVSPLATPQIAFSGCHADARRQDHHREFQPRRPPRRIPLHHRRVRLRQDHRAAARGRSLPANQRRRDVRRPADAAAAARDRDRVPGLWQGAAAVAYRGRQRLAGAGGGRDFRCRTPGPHRRFAAQGRPARPCRQNIRRRCPAACSSACRSRAAWRRSRRRC